MKAQICFAATANLDNVRKQLEDLVANTDFEFVSCFLTRKNVEEKGFSTDIVDLLDECLGDRHTYAVGDRSFDQAMQALPSIRADVALTVNRMYVLDSGTASGVQEEIRLFTAQKVVLLP